MLIGYRAVFSMRGYPTILEIRTEEKIVGGYLSGRQFAYVAVACVQAYFMFQFAGWVTGTFLPPDLELVSYTVFAVLALALGGAILTIGFVPAGFWILPGPTFKLSTDPYEPMIRLDQWFGVMRANSNKQKVLPYKRIFGEKVNQ